MELICFLDENASGFFGILGTVIGFLGNSMLQKWNHKFEINKDEVKTIKKKKEQY